MSGSPRSPFEKVPRTNEPGASHGHAVDGHRRQPHDMPGSMQKPLGKTNGSVLPLGRGSVAHCSAGSVLRENPKDASEGTLPRLGRNELIRECQAILLHFPLKKAAEYQDTTERAVEAQRNGESAMSLLAAVNLGRSNARARAMLGRLLGFTGHYVDPDFMEGMEKLAMCAFARQHLPAEESGSEGYEDEADDLFGGVH